MNWTNIILKAYPIVFTILILNMAYQIFIMFKKGNQNLGKLTFPINMRCKKCEEKYTTTPKEFVENGGDLTFKIDMSTPVSHGRYYIGRCPACGEKARQQYIYKKDINHPPGLLQGDGRPARELWHHLQGSLGLHNPRGPASYFRAYPYDLCPYVYGDNIGQLNLS